jgi:hypothetical protein
VRRLLIIGSLAATLQGNALGRGVPLWTYDQLNRASDVVAIACPTDTVTSTETQSMHGGEMSIIRTRFRVETYLKGSSPKSNLVVKHYRPVDELLMRNDSSRWITFPPNDRICYLLFVKHVDEETYEFASGNDDPDISVKAVPRHTFVSSIKCPGQ